MEKYVTDFIVEVSKAAEPFKLQTSTIPLSLSDAYLQTLNDLLNANI